MNIVRGFFPAIKAAFSASLFILEVLQPQLIRMMSLRRFSFLQFISGLYVQLLFQSISLPQRTMAASIPALCAAEPCQNGGTCVQDAEGDGGYSCQCPLGCAGKNCETVWLSQEVMADLQNSITRLSLEVSGVQFFQVHLSEELAALKAETASLRTLLEVLNGPKAFSKWSSLSEAAVTDLSYLRVGEKDLLLVLTSGHIKVFELHNSSFVLLQSLAITEPQSVETFSISSNHYIVVAGNTTKVFRWDVLTQRLVSSQDILTLGAKDVQHVSVDSLDFLVFACNSDRYTPSYVYTWYAPSNRFLLYQTLHTVGAVRATVRTTNAGVFLSITQEDSPSQQSSLVYKLNATKYFSHLHTFSESVYVFATGERIFAASSAAVHQYDSTTDSFVFHSSFPSSQNLRVDTSYYFSVNTEHYLAVVTIQSGADGNMSPVEVISVYQLNGASFTLHQTLQGEADVSSLNGFKTPAGKEFLSVVQKSKVSFWRWETSLDQ